MSHKSQLVKNTAIIAIGKLSTQILSYILLPLYTARMAPAEFGIYDLICTLSLFLCPVITLLMEESMFRFLIDATTKNEKKRIISQTIIYTLIGVLIFIPLAFIILNTASNYSNNLIWIFILFVISNIIIGLSNALARGLSKIKLYSLSNFILGIVTIILTIIVLLFKPNAEGLLLANSIANILTTFIIFIKLKLRLYIGKPNIPLMKKMIKYSLPLVPNSISWSIINMSDRVILTNIIDSEATGIYGMANKFPNIINVLYGYFYTAWKESAAKIIKDDNKKVYYNSIYHDIKKFLYAITICLIAIMPFAFPIFINKQYNEAFIYIPIIMVATYYSNLSSFYGGIFGAYKATKIMGTTTFVAAAINLIVDLALVWKFGIYAACFSTLIADLIVYFYRKIKLRRYIKLKELKWQGPTLILIIVCVIYYTKYITMPILLYWILNSLSLIIAFAYSIAINYNFIKRFILKIKNRIHTKKQREINNI